VAASSRSRWWSSFPCRCLLPQARADTDSSTAPDTVETADRAGTARRADTADRVRVTYERYSAEMEKR
jgi:hypothetical protein